MKLGEQLCMWKLMSVTRQCAIFPIQGQVRETFRVTIFQLLKYIFSNVYNRS